MKNSGLNKILLFNASRPGGIQGRAGKESRNQTFSPHLSSVQFSHSIMSDSLRPRGLQHARLSCTLSTPVHLLKHMSITSVMPVNHLIFCCPLLLCLQSFPASGSFPVNQLFTSGGQSIGVSASASVLPMNIKNNFL